MPNLSIYISMEAFLALVRKAEEHGVKPSYIAKELLEEAITEKIINAETKGSAEPVTASASTPIPEPKRGRRKKENVV